MTDEDNAAQLTRDRAKLRLDRTIETAKQRLQPRALAADAADAIASRASLILTRTTPTPRWRKALAFAVTLTGIGTSVVMRLHMARQKDNAMKPEGTSAVLPPTPPALEPLP
jgi:predicted kinase